MSLSLVNFLIMFYVGFQSNSSIQTSISKHNFNYLNFTKTQFENFRPIVQILSFYLERRRKHSEIETNDSDDMVVDTEASYHKRKIFTINSAV